MQLVIWDSFFEDLSSIEEMTDEDSDPEAIESAEKNHLEAVYKSFAKDFAKVFAFSYFDFPYFAFLDAHNRMGLGHVGGLRAKKIAKDFREGSFEGSVACAERRKQLINRFIH